VLSLVSRWPRPWTLDQVAARSGYGFGDISRAAHGLLVHDLIRAVRPESEENPETFEVLHLVRHLMRGPVQKRLAETRAAYVRPTDLIVTAPAATPENALTRR
jgi:hypothetical protein